MLRRNRMDLLRRSPMGWWDNHWHTHLQEALERPRSSSCGKQSGSRRGRLHLCPCHDLFAPARIVRLAWMIASPLFGGVYLHRVAYVALKINSIDLKKCILPVLQ